MVKSIYGMNQREIARYMNFSNKPIREPVPAKKRKEVLKRAKNKCQYPRCTIKEDGNIRLHIHHKNMINSDNKLTNLMALCGTHHGVIHREYKRKDKKDLIYGARLSSKVIKVKPKKKITKNKSIKKMNKKNLYALNIPSFKY